MIARDEIEMIASQSIIWSSSKFSIHEGTNMSDDEEMINQKVCRFELNLLAVNDN